jgi:predicted DCC family thiol-disulfide oxidoreductase YuxK
LSTIQAHIGQFKVAYPPKKPFLLYDGGCRFCFRWAHRLRRWTKGRIDCAPYQREGFRFREIPHEQMEYYVQLIETDGVVYSGAAAAFRILYYKRGTGWLLGMYRHVPLFAVLAEYAYDIVSRNRYSL